MGYKYNPHRSRNLYDPKSKMPFKISRSKIDRFVECPRCFYIDRRLGTDRPPGFPFNINSAVDTLLKTEFDTHRAAGTAALAHLLRLLHLLLGLCGLLLGLLGALLGLLTSIPILGWLLGALAFLLGHTTADTDDQPLFVTLQFCQPSQKAKGFLFGFGSNGAGVDDNQIRIVERCGLFITDGCQLHGNLF